MSPFYQKIREQVGQDLLLMPSVAALIRNSSGELLLQQKSDGTWSLPAGAIEPGETPYEALAREVLEETGMTVIESEVVGVFGGSGFRHRYPNGDEVEYTVVLFECSVQSMESSPIDQETVAIEFFDEDCFPGLSLPYPQRLLFPNDLENKAEHDNR